MRVLLLGLGLVQTGKLSLATTIIDAVKQSHCNPPEPPE